MGAGYGRTPELRSAVFRRKVRHIRRPGSSRSWKPQGGCSSGWPLCVYALVIAFGSAYHNRPNGSVSEIDLRRDHVCGDELRMNVVSPWTVVSEGIGTFPTLK
jgi:hypothetical protein